MQGALEVSKVAVANYKEAKYKDALQRYLEAAKLLRDHFSTLTDKKPELIESPIGTIFADATLATCYFAIGNCYKNLEQYEEAVSYFYACSEIADKKSISLSHKKIDERIGLTELHFSENTPFKTSQNYWINIPQGRTGHLIARVDYLQIAGLYSDRFSTCVMVIMKAKNRISMTHLDHMENPDEIPCKHLLADYEWAYKQDQACEFIVVHNQYGRERVKQIKNLITTIQNASQLPLVQSIRLNTIEVNDDICGVKVSFSGGIEFSKTENRPQNILCHPNDLVLSTNRKIEAIFFLSNQRAPNIERVIFDGRFFEPVKKTELTPFLRTSREQEYFEEFSAQSPYLTTARKLLTILEKIKTYNTEIIMLLPDDVLCRDVAHYICMHTKKYDTKKIFCENMAELVHENKSRIALIDEDYPIIAALEKALTNPKTAIVVCQEIVENLKDGNSKFQESLVEEFRVFLNKYIILQTAKRRINQATQSQEQATRLNEKAQQSFLQKNYKAAKNLYLEAFQLLSHSVTRDNIQLIKACESVGHCYFKMDMFDMAFEYFWVAKGLRTIFHSDNKNALDRVDKLMGICQTKTQVTEVASLGYYLPPSK